MPTRLRDLLRQGVIEGKLFCPFNFSLYEELIAINPIDRRVATARLMDELACNMALKNPFEIAMLEYTRFLIEAGPTLRPLAGKIEPVWCRIGWFLGERYPRSNDWPEEFLNFSHKVVWDCGCSRRVADLALLPDQKESPDDTADRINKERKRFPRSNQTFEDLYKSELGAYIDENKERVTQSILDITVGLLGMEHPGTLPIETIAPALNLLLGASLKHLKKRIIPSQQIEAALHAQVRMDDRRKTKQNDIDDFRHAAAALAYCNVFLTDKPLTHLVNSKHVQEVIPMSCEITGDPARAVALVEAIVGKF